MSPSRPQVESGGIASETLHRMLMQVDPAGTGSQKIYLLPAWPKDKALDVAFKLHAPMQTVVEGRLVAGKLEDLVVTPESRRGDVVVVASAR